MAECVNGNLSLQSFITKATSPSHSVTLAPSHSVTLLSDIQVTEQSDDEQVSRSVQFSIKFWTNRAKTGNNSLFLLQQSVSAFDSPLANNRIKKHGVAVIELTSKFSILKKRQEKRFYVNPRSCEMFSFVNSWVRLKHKNSPSMPSKLNAHISLNACLDNEFLTLVNKTHRFSFAECRDAWTIVPVLHYVLLR